MAYQERFLCVATQLSLCMLKLCKMWCGTAGNKQSSETNRENFLHYLPFLSFALRKFHSDLLNKWIQNDLKIFAIVFEALVPHFFLCIVIVSRVHHENVANLHEYNTVWCTTLRPSEWWVFKYLPRIFLTEFFRYYWMGK